MNTKIEVTGEVAHIGQPVQITDKFRKAEIVILAHGTKYPEYIKFEVMNDGCESIKGRKIGEVVTAEGYVGGKQYNKKDGGVGYITSVRLTKIYENKPSQEVTHDDAIPF